MRKRETKPRISKRARNKIPLDAKEAVKIKEIASRIQKDTEELEQEAYTIRLQYLQADGEKYDPEFLGWFKSYEMKNVFGSLSTFTKYAAAGEVMQRETVKKYADRMPRGVTARYEMSKLRDDEIMFCLENRFTRSAVGAEPKAPKKPTPVIRPDSTAKEIRNWAKKWRHPKAKEPMPSDKLTLEELEEIANAITEAMKPFEGYEIAEEIESLLRIHRKRLKRTEVAASKNTKSANG
jgi:hypothetical protein